jgi:hypothetical protein
MKKKNIYILKKQMNAIFAMNFFLKISNANNAVLCAVLPASIAFILLITTTAPCVGIEILNYLIYYLIYIILNGFFYIIFNRFI